MKILQVIPALSPSFGGTSAAVRALSKELAKRHEVVVYTTTALDLKHDFESKEEEVDGYKIYYFSRAVKPLCYSNLFGQLNISLDMMKAIKHGIREFDIVHVHSWRQFQDVIAHYYASKYNVPYVVQTHGSIARVGNKLRKLLYDSTFGYRILGKASKVIALNRVEAVHYKRMGVPEEKIAVIPNGIDLSEYAELPSKGSFKRKFNIPEDKKIILFLGRIHKSKGIDLLIKAYSYLKNEMKDGDTILVIAGPDDGYLNEARNLATSLGLYNSVMFTGFISRKDKLRALVDADVFVTPSFYGFPVTFLESCAVGTPIVTTSLGDTLEWIDGNAGFITQPIARDVAEAIHRIISDDKLRRRFSRNCIEIVKSDFSIEKVVDRLVEVYKEVIKVRVS